MDHFLKKLQIAKGRVAIPFADVVSACLITLKANDFDRHYLKIADGSIPVSKVSTNDVIEFVCKQRRHGCRVSKINDYVISLEVYETTFQAVRAANPLPASLRSEHDGGRLPIWREIDFESPPPWYEFRALLPDWKGARGDV